MKPKARLKFNSVSFKFAQAAGLILAMAVAANAEAQTQKPPSSKAASKAKSKASESLSGSAKRAKDTTPAEELMTVPVRVTSCKVGDEITAAARIEPKEFSELRSGWMSSIEKIYVSVGDVVKKGQMIALVDTKFTRRQITFYEEYLRLLSGQVKSKDSLLKLTKERLSRISVLANKGIVPKSDAEALEREILSIESTIGQTKRQMDTYTDNLKELQVQDKNANFYSPIDGVVSQIIADPQSIVGRVQARGRALVARIDSPGRYVAKVHLSDTQTVKVREGDQATVELRDRSTYQGQVTFVSPIAVSPDKDNQEKDKMVSLYQVEVSFNRPGPILPSEMNSQVTFAGKTPMSDRCIPWNAIEVVDGKPTIRFFDESIGWTEREVALGRRGRYYVELLTDLPSSVQIQSKLW